MNPHTAAAIAQIVFYVPAVPVALYLCIRNWKYGPRMAWYPAVPFTLIRLAGGILTIVEEQNQGNIGIIIATIVLLNIGLIPLITTFSAIVRLILQDNFKNERWVPKFLRLVRWNIIAAIALLSTAGGFSGQTGTSSTGSTLSIVAYVQFAAVLVALAALCLVLYFGKRDRIRAGDETYLKYLLLAIIPLFVRTAYGLVAVFEVRAHGILNTIWSSLFGSAVLFALMALLPEYIALVLYFRLGFYRMQTCKRDAVSEAPKSSDGA
ncbi:hypothetical protein QBC47DRAFT_388038 [Echria macrotheca]|uniref:DUF7702 domain-containing protein n=1 Tax=Echria macrotheca TaxID=438768 RepID=A0AAJ0B7Q2_9PEZI|nr:hypothetical protein QBC47DRAFT_388038 [Echria macrotheca]